MGRKRKTSFIRTLLDKLRISKTVSSDPGEEAQKLEDTQADQQEEELAADFPPSSFYSYQHHCYGGSGSSQYQRQASNSEDQGPARPSSLNCENELAQELRVAFDLYSKGVEFIPCKEIGYILRTLGQNPTEDEIITLVCEAGCEWDGTLTREDFLNVAFASVQQQVNRLDDVKAAFKAFDHNGDGSISKEELKDAMVRFGHTFSAEECDEMFQEADLNCDGKIDWEEFLEMMLPGHAHKAFEDAI